MGARNQVGIGLSCRPASLCSLATQFQIRFLEPIPHPIAGLKFYSVGGPDVAFMSAVVGSHAIVVILTVAAFHSCR